MTDFSNEILSSWQVRKTKKQKTAFIQRMQQQFPQLRIESSGFPQSRNLILGDLDTAQVVYTAHYDTCAQLPFPNFITPKNMWLYLGYQLLLVVPFLALMFLVNWGLKALSVHPVVSIWAAYLIMMIAVFFVFMGGPANKHTANDNTSGVTVLVDTMLAMPPELRDQVTYVFFDLEEAGLFGSASYRAKHKKETKRQLLINFDCVSDGDHLLLVLRKGAHRFADTLAEAFPAEDGKLQREICRRGVFYPSDQSNFPCGVGVAALKKSRKLHILYMNRIHTRRDTVYEAENISYLKNGCIRLAALLSEQENI